MLSFVYKLQFDLNLQLKNEKQQTKTTTKKNPKTNKQTKNKQTKQTNGSKQNKKAVHLLNKKIPLQIHFS